jgi:hypothetical protein
VRYDERTIEDIGQLEFEVPSPQVLLHSVVDVTGSLALALVLFSGFYATHDSFELAFAIVGYGWPVRAQRIYAVC